VFVVREVGAPFFVQMRLWFAGNSMIYAECEGREDGFEIKHLVDDPGWPVINPGNSR
jgi:hypothetical protein